MVEDYWLPPEPVDSNKLKPRRLNQDEYDSMRTALKSINLLAEKIGAERLQQIVGAISKADDEGDEQVAPEGAKTTRPLSIYRTTPTGDQWACHDCKDRGDKWYMQEHRCSRSKVAKVARSMRLQSQRKAKHIGKLEMENLRL